MDFDFKYIKAEGKKLGTILFVHGYAVDYSYFVADKELAKNFDYYAVNLPVHGTKKADLTKKQMKEQIKLEEFAKHVCKFVEEKQLNDFILIGHSMGGAVVSLVANMIPEKIKKLILISPMNFAAISRGLTCLKLCALTMEKKMKVVKYLYKDASLYKDSKD
ncbi:MAG: alpha/beta fold hydrolase [Mycoplasmoidaceae bacterium]|nr:alpha/beta fold hydrolase [Mycoplasmoidaceae bacterium]